MSRAAMPAAPRIDAGDVVLRKAHIDDRAALIDHASDPDVHAYLGGPQPRELAERHLDDVGVCAVTAEPGSYVIADKHTDSFVGTLSLTRRGAHHPGHIRPTGEELELAYALSRRAWGCGVAFQAASAVLQTAAVEMPDEPVIIVTHSANRRSLKLAARLGFVPTLTFEEYGAEQTLALAALHRFRS